MMKYRKIELADIPEIVELYIETFNAAPWNDGWTVETAGKRLHQMINVEDFYGLLAFEDGQLRGMILGCMEQYYDGLVFNIREFCIRNNLRGRGIGSEIFRQFETDLKSLGVTRLILFTSRGEQTEHFYHRQGLHSMDGLVLMGKDL